MMLCGEGGEECVMCGEERECVMCGEGRSV